ncbi:MAG: hypothetical protein ABWZ02_07470, partial [Nakamurella sp.]
MSVPTSLIVVLLVIAWLVVLVPMVARRRERVPQAEAESGGTGFRVLRRASASLRRRPARRPKGQTVTTSDTPDATATDSSAESPARKTTASRISAQTTTTQGFAGGNVIDAPDVLVPVGAEPQDAAEEWAVAHARDRVRSGSHPAFPAGTERDSAQRDNGEPDTVQLEAVQLTFDEPAIEQVAGTGDRVIAGSSPYQPQVDGQRESALGFAPDYQEHPGAEEVEQVGRAEADQIADELDEQEWAAHAAAAPPGAGYTEVDDEQLRPVPHRRGRGGFDPEAAEVTRAYKYQQRRRVTLILFLSTV